MRLTVILIIIATFKVTAGTYAQTVSFSGKDAPLEKAFSAIKQQTGYVVFCDYSLLESAKPVTIRVENEPLQAFLQQLLNEQPLEYFIRNKTIVISRKAAPVTSVAPFLVVDSTIRGEVTDMEGKPLPGASVRIKGASTGTATDANGKFSINASEGTHLVVTFIGYGDVEMIVKNGRAELATMQTGQLMRLSDRIIVRLPQGQSPLDEVKVIGYGTTTQRFNTGSVTTITAKDIEKQPVSNILLALQGRISGMQITPASGVVGSAPDVRIRGINSIAAGYSPLFILDGVPVPEKMSSLVSNPLDNGRISLLLGINPAEIERVDVLKDADATAIYGSRGASGVVLITTKKGAKDGLKVSLNANTGFQKVPHFIDMMDVHQYNAMRREAMANDGIVPTALNAPDLFNWDSTKVRDWQQELIGGTAVSQDVNLSLSGGSRTTQFYVSAGYHKEGSVTPANSDFTRKSFRANMNHTSTDGRLIMNATSFYSVNDLNLPTNSMASFINLPPHYPLYTADGKPDFSQSRSFPFASLLQTYSDPSQMYGGNIKAGYEVMKGLRLSISAGINNTVSNQSYKQPLISLDPARYTSGTLRISNNTNSTWIVEPQAEYTGHAGLHHFKLMAGGTFQRSTVNQVSINGSNFLDDALINNISAAGTKEVTSSTSMYSYASAFGRITYDYDQKYLVNLSFRRDGSSRFGPGKRFGNFGAVGLGWIFTQEPSIQHALPFLSYGKLRASYGISGNDQISDFGYLSNYTNLTSPTLMYTGLSIRAARLANPDYRWEETRKLEAALELGFVKDRVILTASFFQNRSGNQLISYSLGPQSGFGNYQANFPAIVQNRGAEIDITSKNLTGDLQWSTTLTLSQSSNVLFKYDNIEKSSYYSIYVVGKALSLLQSFTYLGLDANGVPKFQDKNSSNSIDWRDAIPNNNNNPLFGGLSNDFSWKGIGLSFFWQFTHTVGFSNLVTGTYTGGLGRNETVRALERWQKPGDEKFTDMPRYTTRSSTYDTRVFGQADRWMETRNILRLNNISLSYDIPATLLKKAHISRCQVYMNGQNIFVFDKYSNVRYDPSTGNGALPMLRTIVFGINSSF